VTIVYWLTHLDDRGADWRGITRLSKCATNLCKCYSGFLESAGERQFRAMKSIGKQSTFAPPRALSTAFCVALLILQPVVFFWRVLVNPSKHIPYDIYGFHLPLISYVAQCVRKGVAPLWDPYTGCGVPIHADVTAQVFYPFTWLAILAGNLSKEGKLYYWVETLDPLHMVMAGMFTFLLLRRMGLAKPAALMGASVYQLGAYFASQAQHLGGICTGAWLPLAILCAWELRVRLKWRWVALLALTMAMVILSGMPATAAVVVVTMMLFIAGLFAGRAANWRILPGVGLACLLGAAIAAVELVPLLTLTQNSLASRRSNWYVSGGGLAPESLVSFVWPDYYHIFEAYSALYKLPYDFTLLYTYCGIMTAIFLAVAPFVRRSRVFLILTVASAVWMLGEHTPIYRWIYPHIPRLVRGGLYAEYALMAFCFFAAITAAMVLDRLGGRWPPAVLWCVALFTSYDLIYTGADRPMNSYEGGYRGTSYEAAQSKVAEKLRSLVERSFPPSRVDYTDTAFAPGVFGPGMIRVPTPDNNNPFSILRSWNVRELFATGQPWVRNHAVNRFGSPLLRMLNVSILMGAVPIPQEEVARAGLTLIGSEQGFQIYATASRLPRFYFVPQVRKSSGASESLGLLSRDAFDPAREAIVEGIPQDRDGLGIADVKVDQYEANRVELTASLDRPGFLVSSEVLYPGWQATVNGEPAPLLMTNGAFRGLALPAGTSRIVMAYRPRALFFSMGLSLVALLGTMAIGWRGGRRQPEL